MFEELLSTLPAAQRNALHLAFCRGLTHREIAREAGISLSATKTHLELGVKKLCAAVVAKGFLGLREAVTPRGAQ
jgi:RNA polymerase sigma-70 factor (ECF subfamily)